MSVAIQLNKGNANFKISIPVINFAKYRKNNNQQVTCPICGRKFYTRFAIDNANPEQGIYCRNCSPKVTAMHNNQNITSKEFKTFKNSRLEVIDQAIGVALVDSRTNKNLSLDDIKHEMDIQLFRTYSYAKKKNIDPYSYSNKYIMTILKRAVRLDDKELRRESKINQESYYENKYSDTDHEAMDKIFYTETDIDSHIDLQNILSKIVKLARKSKYANLALERAWIYGGETRVGYEGEAFVKRFCKQTGYGPRACWDYVKKGIEYIYYNDYKNISDYIDINNLKNTYRFNSAQSKYLSEEEFGKELAILLEYYSGYRTCAICGTRFKPDAKWATAERVMCSDECRKENRKRLNKEFKARQKQMASNK